MSRNRQRALSLWT